MSFEPRHGETPASRHVVRKPGHKGRQAYREPAHRASRTLRQTAALSGSDNSTDCHGTTFAQGEVWIENNQAKKIINNDGYRPLADNEAPQVGDVGIYAQGKKFDLGNTQHSVLVNSVLNGQVQSVISKGGITNRSILPPGPGAGTAWNSAYNLSDKANTQLKYFTKRVQQ